MDRNNLCDSPICILGRISLAFIFLLTSCNDKGSCAIYSKEELTIPPEEVCIFKTDSVILSMHQMTNLEKLYLWGKNVEHFPSGLKMPKLTHFSSQVNSFQAFPSELNNFPQLSNIEISLSELTLDSLLLPNLTKLESLCIWKGNFTPSTKFYIGSQTLKELAFGDCDNVDYILNYLHEHKKLDSLERLYLSDCDLREVPKAIFEMKNLKFLNLASNDLSVLNKRIVDLHSLEELNLTANPSLINLPDNLGEMKALKIVHLGSTKTLFNEALVRSINENNPDLIFYTDYVNTSNQDSLMRLINVQVVLED